MALVLSPPSASALGICLNRAALGAPDAFLRSNPPICRKQSKKNLIHPGGAKQMPLYKEPAYIPVHFELFNEDGDAVDASKSSLNHASSAVEDGCLANDQEPQMNCFEALNAWRRSTTYGISIRL